MTTKNPRKIIDFFIESKNTFEEKDYKFDTDKEASLFASRIRYWVRRLVLTNIKIEKRENVVTIFKGV